MSSDQLFRPETVMFLVGGMVAIVWIGSAAIARVLVHREETRLKLRMVEQGFSAEEIARVVEVSSGATYEE